MVAAHNETNPEDFLTLAEVMMNWEKFKKKEPIYRTIINRCYLASVLQAERILMPMVGPFPKTHEYYREVEDKLAFRGAPQSRDKLGTLRKMRLDADYDLSIPIPEKKAELAISTAKEVFQHLRDEIK